MEIERETKGQRKTGFFRNHAAYLQITNRPVFIDVAGALLTQLESLGLDLSADQAFGILHAVNRAIDWRYTRDKDMKIEIEASLSELTKAAGVMVGELKKLGMEIRLEQALGILNAILSAFRGSKKDEEGEGDEK